MRQYVTIGRIYALRKVTRHNNYTVFLYSFSMYRSWWLLYDEQSGFLMSFSLDVLTLGRLPHLQQINSVFCVVVTEHDDVEKKLLFCRFRCLDGNIILHYLSELAAKTTPVVICRGSFVYEQYVYRLQRTSLHNMRCNRHSTKCSTRTL